MSNHQELPEQETGADSRPTRRRFLQLVGGSVVGACVVGRVQAQGERPSLPLPGAGTSTAQAAAAPFADGGEPGLLPHLDTQDGLDRVPNIGPLVMLAPPQYDPVPQGQAPRLRAHRFLSLWDEALPNWFGAGQCSRVALPTFEWLGLWPEVEKDRRCAVATVWNKGREPAYNVMMRVLTFVMYQAVPRQWQEICRADLGWVHIGALTPGDYIEVRYAARSMRHSLEMVYDQIRQADLYANKYRGDLWFCHRCFAWDPVRDALKLDAPLKIQTPANEPLGGRHGAGWRWIVKAPLLGKPRPEIPEWLVHPQA